MATAKLSGGSPSDETARWVAGISDELAAKLAHHELIELREARDAAKLGAFLKAHIAGRAKLKPNTLQNYEQTRRRLVDYFGADKPLARITAGDADEWRQSMLATLSLATVSRDVRRARQFLEAAVMKELIARNPFCNLPASAQVNDSRVYFVTRTEADSVLKACPDAEWQLIFALSRYGGLRTPSEHLALKWGHVDWERGRLTVPSPKTEHHRKGASRTIPIFPELLPYLEACYANADEGQEFVINRYCDGNANLRTQLNRIIARAGLNPWPKLFHNLRATRQTELAAEYPLHVVCEWIGNSATIANQHYLTVTDADFQRAKEPLPESAAQNAAQSVHETPCTDSLERMADGEKTLLLQSCATLGDLMRKRIVPRRGVEPLSPP